jgi:hypothetical protein
MEIKADGAKTGAQDEAEDKCCNEASLPGPGGRRDRAVVKLRLVRHDTKRPGPRQMSRVADAQVINPKLAGIYPPIQIQDEFEANSIIRGPSPSISGMAHPAMPCRSP